MAPLHEVGDVDLVDRQPLMRYRRLFDLRLGDNARVDAEMDREIEAHIAMRAADLEREGWSAEDARAEARRRFGNFDDARKRLHAAARQREANMRQRDRLGSFIADVRYALRQAQRAPGFTALAIATLALGIGATTTMFTLVDSVLLRPLPFPHPERLMMLFGADSAKNEIQEVSSADWLDWRRAQSLESSALYSFQFRQGIIVGDSAVRVNSETVSGEFFKVLSPKFVAGRGFTNEEAQAGEPVVVIGERMWRSSYGADPKLAAPLRTSGQAYKIVGVVADGAEFPAQTDVWMPTPITLRTDPTRINVNWLLVARLRPGVSAAAASAELSSIARGILAFDPTALYDHGASASPLAQFVVGPVSLYLTLLMGVVLCVLLIVCANVAASSLARASVRAREMAVRTSLGAARHRLVQQLLIEHVMLGILGGAIGLFVAWISLRGILVVWGDQIPRANAVTMDARVFAFALGISIVAGALAGTIPALRLTRFSLREVLSSGGRTSASGGRNLAGSSLVSLEIALAVLLLTGAALLIRSFRSVIGRDIGFDTNVATAEAMLSGPLYARDSVRRFAYWESLIDEFQRIPGVRAVGVANWIPLGITGQGFIDVDGHAATSEGAIYRTVSPGFFDALDMQLIAGRLIGKTDGPGTQRVVVINRTMANKYWPGENPLGKLVRARSMEGAKSPWLTVVGVVGDVRGHGLESDVAPEMYVFYRQAAAWRSNVMTVLVRGPGRASSLFAEMKKRAHSVDPRLAIDVGTLDTRLRNRLAQRTLTMSLLSGFAGIALILAALGIYGVLSYAVTQRTRELAVRAALGARPPQLLGLVLAAGIRVVVVGLAFGIVAAFWLMRMLQSMLVDVSPLDPVSYVGAVVVLFIVSLAAIVIPALRATRLDPMIALQSE
jgi:putative ABC transport system permease protein